MLLRRTDSWEAAEHHADALAARRRAVLDAYARAHSTTGGRGRPRRASPRTDDVPRRSR